MLGRGGGKRLGGACVATNKLPQLGVHFNLQSDVLKYDLLDEGHLPVEDSFYFFGFSFLYFLLGQKAGVIETRHKSECEAFTGGRPQFLSECGNRMNPAKALLSLIGCLFSYYARLK